ncbi:MAG: aldo/keto reductase [Opitutaceae bacterium]|jgi:aryl-alcohol dehydrogenase-like predicted oxidoreductase
MIPARNPITRREVLQRLALLTGAALMPWRAKGAAEEASSDKLGPILPRRTLGKTGLRVTMLTVGGSHIGRPQKDSDAQAVIEAAIEAGIRTFDTAQLYQNGGSEIRYGKFLTPKYREQVLIFTKTMAEDADTARAHLDLSLQHLKTDYVDLWELHDIRTIDKADLRVAKVLDVMLKAKEQGRVRHIGFTGHASWKTHAHVLGLTDAFETCQMPINIADPSFESFTMNVLPILVQRNMGVLAMKTLAAAGLMGGRGASGPKVIPDRLSVHDALRYVWSLPISTLVSGMQTVPHLKANVASAQSFIAMDEAERQALVDKVADVAKSGEMENGFKGQVGS